MSIHTVRQNQSITCLSEVEMSSLKEFATDEGSEFFYFTNGRIKSGKYAGVISFANRTVLEILPDIGWEGKGSPGVDDSVMREIFVRMICTSLGLKIKETRDSQASARNIPILEVFVSLFIQMTEDLMKKGLRHGYSTVDENQRYVSGRILHAQNIRRNMVVQHAIFVRHNVFNRNRPENRILKTCSELLYRNSGIHKMKLKRILETLDDVPSSVNIESDLRTCTLDRNMQHYGGVLSLCRMFLRGLSYAPVKGVPVEMSLMFDMNKLFEDYVIHSIQNRCSKMGFSIYTNTRRCPEKRYLYDSFELVPDIIIKYEGKTTIVDAKWKNPETNSGDAYQMFSYCHGFRCEKAILIYPSLESEIICSRKHVEDGQTRILESRTIGLLDSE